MKHTQYLMTEQQIEALAAERTQTFAATEAFDGTYLKALLTGVQAKLGSKKGKRLNTDSQLDGLESVAVPFYAAVLRGVTTPEIALGPDLEAAEATRRTRERNRRATFARTTKSTIVSWVNAGGDLRALNVATVTKSELRAAVHAARAEEGVPAASRVERAQNAILNAVARDPPAIARERLHAVIEALQEAIDALPPVPARDHGESTVIRSKGGVSFRGHMQRGTVAHRGATP